MEWFLLRKNIKHVALNLTLPLKLLCRAMQRTDVVIQRSLNNQDRQGKDRHRNRRHTGSWQHNGCVCVTLYLPQNLMVILKKITLFSAFHTHKRADSRDKTFQYLFQQEGHWGISLLCVLWVSFAVPDVKCAFLCGAERCGAGADTAGHHLFPQVMDLGLETTVL